MTPINSRADLEALRGTPEFEEALRLTHGATKSWTNAGTAEQPDWQLVEDSSILTRLEFTPAAFAAEIAGMGFAGEVPAAPAVSLDDVKASRIAAVKAKHFALEQAGYQHDFGPGHGIGTLQVRNNTDKTNWLTAQAMYSAQVVAGNGAVEGATFRTAENNNVTLSFSAALAVILQMAAWGGGLAQVAWSKQDALRAATTLAEAYAVSIDTGWPP